LKKGQISC